MAADADPDGDGASNLQEFTTGSDPTNPASGFRVDVKAIPMISWVSVPALKYRVLRSPVLPSTNWVVVLDNAVATGPLSTYIDTNAPANSFYVIQSLP